MNEIASVTIKTKPLLIEVLALLRLILHVHLLVLLQLNSAVRELAPVLVRAHSHLHELFAQLGFFFVVFRVEVRTAMAGLCCEWSWGGLEFVGLIDGVGEVVRLKVKSHRWNYKVLLFVISMYFTGRGHYFDVLTYDENTIFLYIQPKKNTFGRIIVLEREKGNIHKRLFGVVRKRQVFPEKYK